MSTKQIFEINMDKNKLEEAINYSWNIFLENEECDKANLIDSSTDSTLLKYKNFFTHHINEFYKEFENKKGIIQIDSYTFYDRNNKSLLSSSSIIDYYTKVAYMDTDLFNKYIKYTHDKLPFLNKNIYFRNGDDAYVYYIDKKNTILERRWFDVDKEDNSIIYAFKTTDKIKSDLKSILFMLITSDFYSNEFSNSKNYKILKSFTYENEKFILKNPENLKIGKEYFIPLLSEDKIRADLKEYDEKMLEDVERGLWELWEMTNEKSKMVI